MTKLAILGTGSWGTALSIVLAPRFDQVVLWTHESELSRNIGRDRENAVYLPGFPLPPNVTSTTDAAICLDNAEIVLGVMPSRYARSLYHQFAPYLLPDMRYVSATKGLESLSLLRISQVMREVIGPSFPPRIAVLSGPTFAREIAAGNPAAVVIASDDAELAAEIQHRFSGRTLRLYRNHDPVGVELAGSLKNVIAIAAGLCHGLGLGSNAQAALVTRGLAEITRLAVPMGAQSATLAGLAGLGDLVLTCTGELSRNRSVGIELARGRQIAEIIGAMPMIAEGVETTAAAATLALKYGVEMPITQQLDALLQGRKSAHEAVRDLMKRSLKLETL